MSIEPLALAAAKWFWGKYGKDLVDKATLGIGQKWKGIKWGDAEDRYRFRLLEQHSTARLLGHPQSISIVDLFTDVFILDKMTAFRHFDIAELQKKPLERQTLRINSDRKNAVEVILNEKRVYILGKPGSGKTTLLKHIVLEACTGKIERTPMFVSLQEWANSGHDLLPYITQLFDICDFPDAEPFIKNLLSKGKAIVLFDGLDEVRQERQKKIIEEIIQFTHKYPDVQVCLTCRLAATTSDFDQFTYLEIAEFDETQIRKFIYRWYEEKKAMRAKMLFELDKPENEGLRELAQTPLLLALLCLVFDEIGYFPKRRVDLYKESTDALLKKWDESKGVERDVIYHDLSPVNKKKLLMYIAQRYFEKGVYFIDEEELSREIAGFFRRLSPDEHDTPDGEAILHAIETQHGLLVKRGRGIYSFLHLTFQEYFTALYMIENISDSAITNLFKKRLNDKRWDEIYLMVTSLL